MSPSAELVCVHPSLVPAVWPLVEGRLRAAYLRTDLGHTIDLKRLAFEDGQLWVVMAAGQIVAAVVTTLARTDRHLVCTIAAIGGADRQKWLPLIAKIEDWARAEGAAVVRIYGRKGWTRVLPEYRETNVIIEKRLKQVEA